MMIVGVFRAMCPRRRCGWASYGRDRPTAMKALAHHLRDDHPRLGRPYGRGET